MLLSKVLAAAAIGFALPSYAAQAPATEAQQIAHADAACNQERQFRLFLQQLAISDGNTKGWPYADAASLKECSARGDNGAKSAAAERALAGTANVTTARY